MSKLNRMSNFELLRVFSMVLIICHHMILYADYRVINSYSLFNFIYSFFYCGGKLGVILFIMITGYFMIDKEFSIKRIVRLECQVLFYSVFSFLIYKFFGLGELDSTSLAKVFFPNLMNTYWFFTCYFLLCFFMPFINKFVKKMGEIEFRKLLIIGFVFFILIPSLVIYRKAYSSDIYLLYYYLVGGYIKLFYNNIKIKKRYLIVGSILSYSMIVLFYLILSNLGMSNPVIEDYVFSFAELKSIFMFVTAICLFLLFKQLNVKNSKFINLLGSVSFGVYLFHDNFLMRKFLFVTLTKIANYYDSSFFVVYGLIVALLIYFVGGVLEYFRMKIFDDGLFYVVWDKLTFLKFIESKK